MMRASLSHTRKTVFRRCRRMHHLQYDLGVYPIVEAIQLQVGDVAHKWLESWFETAEIGQVFDGGRATSEPGWHAPPRWVSPVGFICDPDGNTTIPEIRVELAFDKLDKRDPFEAARLRAMVLGYHLRWRDQSWLVREVERKFRCDLLDPDADIGAASADWDREGRIDAIVELTDGGSDDGAWIVEHKSHNGPLDPGDAYFTGLRANPQVSDYFIGAEAIGYAPRGVIYDVMCKPNIEPLKATPVDKRKYTKETKCPRCFDRDGEGSGVVNGAPCHDCLGSGRLKPRLYANQRDRDETPGEYGMRCFQMLVAEPKRYYHRVHVHRLEHELVEHMRDDWCTAQDITAESPREHHARNPDACHTFGRRCEYFPVCWSGDTIHNDKLYKVRPRKPITTTNTEDD